MQRFCDHFALSVSSPFVRSFFPTSMSTPATKRVLITGAAGQIGYSLVPLVAMGKVCGENTPVDLVLFDIPQALASLKGLLLEIEDGAYPLLRKVIVTDDISVAFEGVQVALMVGGFPRLPGMDRKDLLAKNAQIFVAAGKALNEHADKNCKILVVANPANTNCYIMQQNAPSIPKENFSCLTRLDHNRAVSQAAIKAGVPAAAVKRITIWGNHSNTMVPDLDHASINGAPAAEAIADAAWVKDSFTPTVQNRGAAVLAARQKSSAMSAANGVANHVYDWLNGTADKDDWVSMGVVSQGWYGVAKDIVFSFPVKVTGDGKYTVVEGLEISADMQAAIKASEAELLKEKATFEEIQAEAKQA